MPKTESGGKGRRGEKAGELSGYMGERNRQIVLQ